MTRGESNLEWLFSISEILTHWVDTPPVVPWDFHDGAHGNWEPESHVENMIAELWDDGSITTEDLVTFGQVLNRYNDILRAAGKDFIRE